MECYCTCIKEILRYFFILQSLTTSKMRKFQTLKLSQFHKAKTCWTENWWSSGIMSNFSGEFFKVLGVKKILFLELNRNYLRPKLSNVVLNPLYSDSNYIFSFQCCSLVSSQFSWLPSLWPPFLLCSIIGWKFDWMRKNLSVKPEGQWLSGRKTLEFGARYWTC